LVAGARNDLAARGEKMKNFDTALGTISLEQTTFSVDEVPGLRLVIYSPTDEITRDIVRRLRSVWRKKHRTLPVADRTRSTRP
jgi:hypothetical protein